MEPKNKRGPTRKFMRQIARLGGLARAAKLSAYRQSQIGRKAGLASAMVRLEKISPRRRRQIARHAAQARWGTRLEPEAAGNPSR